MHATVVSDLDAGCDALRNAGYRPLYLDSILERDLYFAGSATRRARELEEMFERDDFNTYPVEEDAQIVGLVTKFDVLKCFAFTPSQMEDIRGLRRS